MGELTVYQISEDELRMIESGGPASTYLNLAIFFLSIGITMVASLLLSDQESVYRFVVLIAVTVGSLIAGVVLLVLWRRSAKDASSVLKRIRSRALTAEITVESQDKT